LNVAVLGFGALHHCHSTLKEINRRMVPVAENAPFSLLPYKRPPWTQFLISLGTQGAAIFVVLWVGAVHLQILPQTPDRHYVPLVTSVPVNLKPAPIRVIKAPTLVEPSPEALRLPTEVRREKQPDDLPVAPKVTLAVSKPEPLPTATPVIPRQLVKTDVFSTGSSAKPTIAAAPQKVQTGGFGDPNGVPSRENNGKPVNIAQSGSFDLPSGPGYGNGTAGAKGTRGVVASAGFGNSTAIGDGTGTVNPTRGNAVVQHAGFGDVVPAAATTRIKPAENAASKTVSAEIISKPNPIYTDEARKLRIEGEVLLEVVFESGGKVRVVRVVRGLGHGLDEAAARAAEQIRFRPAQQSGQPVDFPAVLHILFQLA
ncbi:MAG TPA: energy transducer TonB, partial [Terriglobales bacterium]|nr:energy transducer TonB [Terriglobales bacterium]